MPPKLLKTTVLMLVFGLGTPGCRAPKDPPKEKPAQKDLSPAVTAVMRELRSEDLDTRLKAIKRCQELGPAAAPAAKILVGGYFFWRVEDEKVDEQIQEELDAALIAIGPECAPAIIIDLGADEMDAAGPRLLKAMGPAVIPKLIEAIEEEETLGQIRIFWRVADLLGQFGKKAEAAIPALEKAAQYDDPDYPRIANEAIRKIRKGKGRGDTRD